jgi:tetratricopeptide (TPR) repeat protein
MVPNPWAHAGTRFAPGAPIRLVYIPTPRYGTLEPDARWSNVNNLIESDNVSEALPLIQNQMKMNPSLDSMYSTVNMLKSKDVDGPEVEALRAKTLKSAEEEIEKGSDRQLPYVAAAKLTLEDGDDEKFNDVADKMEEKFPDSEYTAYFTGLKKLKNNDFKGAEAALRQAEEKGMPADSVAAFLKAAIDNQKWVWEYAAWTGYALGGWAVGLGLLFLLGKTLSTLTLRSVDRGAEGVASPTDRALRFVYRGVIGAAGAYYYLSLPMVLLAAIALPLSLGYAALMLPYVNIGLIVIVFVLGSCGVLTALSGIRTAFVRVKEFDYGRPCAPAEAPALWNVVRDVAKKVGTRPVDEIRIVPSAELAVVELGGMLRRSLNKGKRVLILGVGAMQGLKLHAFQSILAHEYGHFQNRDTAGGNVSLRVNLSMKNFADAVKKRGEIHWYDLAVQFLRLYHYLFRRLTFGASRLQEVLADRVAVLCYGRNALVEGLTHAIRRAVEFDMTVSKAIRDALCAGRPATAFYKLSATMDLDERESVESAVKKILNRQTDLDDSHPSPKDRFEMASRIKADNPSLTDELAWTLIADNDAVVGAMGRLVDEYVAHESREIVNVHNFILQYLTEVIRMNPFPANYLERSRVYLAQGKYDKALADLDQAIQRDKKNPVAFFRRAIVHKLMEKYEEAVEDLSAAEEICPTKTLGAGDRFAFYSTQGVCLARLGRDEEAIEAFNGAILATPSSLMARVERGRCFAARQEFARAMDDFTWAIKHWPNSPEPYLERAKIYETLGREDKAERDQEKARWLAPHAVENLEKESERTPEPVAAGRSYSSRR